MATSETFLENLDHAPHWARLRMEYSLLLADLINDSKYSDRVKHIGELLADPHFPTIEQIYFVPR
jgi:hypothetical protein